MTDRPRLPERPVSLARVELSSAGQTRSLVLTEHGTWHNHVLDGNIDNHREQPSTELTPSLLPGEGSVVWFVGYDLGDFDSEGDTRRVYSLLLELTPHKGANLRALWYADHMTVPRTFALGAGPLEAGGRAGLMRFDLALTDADHGDEIRIKGVLNRS